MRKSIATVVFVLIVWLSSVGLSFSEDLRLAGFWRLNLKASDDVDREIERAVKRAGRDLKPPAGKNRKTRGRYRGGPEDEELYDHIAYDDTLQISIDGTRFDFIYPGGFQRTFYSDRTTRSLSASGTTADDRGDFSFAYWDGESLQVESAPRDQGRVLERYRFLPDQQQLELVVELQPGKFRYPVEALLIFDRSTDRQQ